MVRRTGARFSIEEGTGCRFVPLIGEEAFDAYVSARLTRTAAFCLTVPRRGR